MNRSHRTARRGLWPRAWPPGNALGITGPGQLFLCRQRHFTCFFFCRGQGFAKAYRAMQLEGSMFAVCVIQVERINYHPSQNISHRLAIIHVQPPDDGMSPGPGRRLARKHNSHLFTEFWVRGAANHCSNCSETFELSRRYRLSDKSVQVIFL